MAGSVSNDTHRYPFFQVSPPLPSICHSVQAMVGLASGALIVSKDKVWEMGDSGDLVRAEHTNINTVWPGLPRYPDTGFTWHNGLQYIFKGRLSNEASKFQSWLLEFKEMHNLHNEIQTIIIKRESE